MLIKFLVLVMKGMIYMLNEELIQLETVTKQPVEVLVFSAGGAKGFIYPGVLQALETAPGLIEGVKAVAGCSAGSMTAAFVATGISSHEAMDLQQGFNFKKMLGSKFIPLKYSAQPLYKFVKENILKNIKKNLQGKKIDLEGNDERTYNELLEKLNSPEPKITFEDLGFLHKIDPIKFKHLAVSAVERNTGKLKMFSSIDTPNIEIAEACLASMSIPILIAPKKIDGIEYVDGAYYDALPTEYFENKRQVLKSKAKEERHKADVRTLIFAFGEGENAKLNIDVALYSSKERIYEPGFFERLLRDYIIPFFAKIHGEYRNTDRKEEVYQKLRRRYALNTVALKTNGVSGTNFYKAEVRSKSLKLAGYFQTMDHLYNHDLIKDGLSGIEEPNINYMLQSFFFEVYQRFENQLYKNIDLSDANSSKALKLLRFCQKEDRVYKDGSSPDEIIKQFIEVAKIHNNPSKGIRCKSRTMAILIEALKDPFTPSKVKREFMKIPEIEKLLGNAELHLRNREMGVQLL